MLRRNFLIGTISALAATAHRSLGITGVPRAPAAAGQPSLEELCHAFAEYAMNFQFEPLVKFYHPGDLKRYRQVILEIEALTVPYGQESVLQKMGLNAESAQALSPQDFLQRSLESSIGQKKHALENCEVTMTSKILKESGQEAQVEVTTQAKLEPKLAQEIGELSEELVTEIQKPNTSQYTMMRDGEQWYIRFDNQIEAALTASRQQVEKFRSMAENAADVGEQETLVLIEEDDLYGYATPEGRVIIAPCLLGAKAFSEGLAPVRFFHFWGFITPRGKIAISPQFKDARPFSEGLAAVENEKGLWGYVDPRGAMVIPFNYKNAEDFKDGRAKVTDANDVEGWIDRAGNFSPV